MGVTRLAVSFPGGPPACMCGCPWAESRASTPQGHMLCLLAGSSVFNSFIAG